MTVPGLEPVGQRDHREVATERRTGPRGDRLGRGDPGQHPDRHLRVPRILAPPRRPPTPCRTPRRRRRRPPPPAPREGQVQREPGPVHLDGVAGSVPLQTFSLRHPVHVGRVADHVVDTGQRRGHLGGDPGVRSRAQPDDQQFGRAARRSVPTRRTRRRPARRPAVPARHDDDREVRHRSGIHVRDRDHAPAARWTPARRTARRPAGRPARSASRTAGKVRPSFMIAAPWVSASRRASSGVGSVPGSTSARPRAGPAASPAAAAAADTEVTPGTTSVGNRPLSRSCRYM